MAYTPSHGAADGLQEIDVARSPRLTDRRAYIVDDEQALRSLIRRILVPAGILTEEFSSAEEFLSSKQTRPLGCILLDVRLPGMSGMGLLEQLLRDEVRHPVIMISGHGDISLAVGAIKSGALDFVEKPFRNHKLLETVRSAFGIVATMSEARFKKIELLSPRERAVLKAFVDRSTDKVVGRALDLSPRTIEATRASIIKKLDVRSFTQALFLAKDAGILS